MKWCRTEDGTLVNLAMMSEICIDKRNHVIAVEPWYEGDEPKCRVLATCDSREEAEGIVEDLYAAINGSPKLDFWM